MARILICDDAKFMRMMTERVLRKMGHEVMFKAANGQEALDYYVNHWANIDLIMLDVVMPKMDGLQVLRQILLINPRAKVIMVTSISNSYIVTGAMRTGALEFVTKPFKLSEFVRAVNKVIA